MKKGRKGRGDGFYRARDRRKIMMALFSRHARAFREAFGIYFVPPFFFSLIN